MGIYIEGMKMPKNCGVCPFCVPEADEDNGDICVLCGQFPLIKQERSIECPLIPVPPHGDLIGRNPLIDIAMHLRNRAKDEYTKRVIGSVIRYIAEAPTIIPAEED